MAEPPIETIDNAPFDSWGRGNFQFMIQSNSERHTGRTARRLRAAFNTVRFDAGELADWAGEAEGVELLTE
jgi:hypothetical protein